MRSRLAFAIACMVDPEILILDEVLSVGDGGFRRKSEQKMMEVIQGGATTLFVSHSVAQMKRLCNKVLWLDMGKQIAFAKNKQESEKILTCYSCKRTRKTDCTKKASYKANACRKATKTLSF